MKITYIICNLCGDTVFSFARHSMNWCECKSCALDGGFEYSKITGELDDISLMNSDIKSSIGLIREKFIWTSIYDSKGKLLSKPKVRILKDMETSHILAIMYDIYDRNSPIKEIFKEELKYRKNNKLK